MTNRKKKLVAIGLDGASWDFIQPWIDNGKLPFFKKLQKNSCWGISNASYPISTCPLWKCYSTGKNPGKLEIFGWSNVEKENRKIVVVNSRSFKSKEFWDLLAEQGIKTGIINMPITFPVKPVNGFMVGGSVPNNSLEYTYPKSLQAEIEKEFNYNAKLEGNLTVDSKEFRKKIEQHIKARFNLAKKKLPSVNFLQLVIFCTDIVMHFHWRKDLMLFTFQVIDKEIENFCKDMDSKTLLIIMSDHGFQKLETILNTNTWFEQQGILVLKKNRHSALHRIGINRDSMAKLASMFGILSFVQKNIPEKTRHKLRSSHGIVGGAEKTDIINWDKTIAFNEALENIYILSKGPEYKKQIERISKEFLQARLPNGKKVVQKVFKKEELFSGNHLENAPDLVIKAVDGIEVMGGIGEKKVFSRHGIWTGIHHPKAVYLILGKGIKKGKGKDIRILDFAPTILHYFNVAIPKDLDGKPMLFAFGKKSDFAQRKERKANARQEVKAETRQEIGAETRQKVKTKEKIEHEKEIEKELKRLGYI